MVFLIDYDRRAGELVTIREFAGEQRLLASDARLELELSHQRHGIEREVVVLEAATKEALMKTHRRYFADLDELNEGFKEMVRNA